MTVSTQTDLSPEAYWKGVAERALAKHHDYEEALRISREQTSKILDVVWALHDCLKPFADIGIASNPDYAPSIRCNSDVRRAIIEECAKCVPSDVGDDLLTGPDAPIGPLDARDVVRLLRGIQARIRATAAVPAGNP